MSLTRFQVNVVLKLGIEWNPLGNLGSIHSRQTTNQQTIISKDVEKREPLCTVGVFSWGSHCGEHYGGSSEN